jgi:hypothetical protein
VKQTKLKLERARQRSTPLHLIGLDLRLFALGIHPRATKPSTPEADTVSPTRIVRRFESEFTVR